MRAVLLVVVLVALCSDVRAENIEIVGVVANYVTARDAVDIEIWLDRPLNMQSDWLSFGGGDAAIGGHAGVMFGFQNGAWQNPADEFSLLTRRALSHPLGQVWVEQQTTPDVDYATRQIARDGVLRSVVSFSFQRDALRIGDMRLDRPNEFTFSAVVRFTNDRGFIDTDSVSGISTVNTPTLINTPEPSSIALASLGVIGLLAHRFRRQRRRYPASRTM